jgi:hypothetical protein
MSDRAEEWAATYKAEPWTAPLLQMLWVHKADWCTGDGSWYGKTFHAPLNGDPIFLPDPVCWHCRCQYELVETKYVNPDGTPYERSTSAE